ncbi:MAG TPA: Tat pathway signal sequence, partial [Propionibacteriaceae bacterium]|nr:Tat pathway signal sequence [Propionibacteriaceae bacterium]
PDTPGRFTRFGPDPSVNEWNMLVVGFPIWLWTDRPTTVSTTAHHDGLDFTLTATWTSTTFTMGDGNTKTCAATTIRPKKVRPATKPSPTCGYVYQTKSKIGHPYTVTADTHWRIDWSTNGYNGTFDHTYSGNRTLEIGELQSLING